MGQHTSPKINSPKIWGSWQDFWSPSKQVIEDPSYIPTFLEKWNYTVLLKIFTFFLLLIIASRLLPNKYWDGQARNYILVMGGLGIWRYSWWFTHAVRAVIYRRRYSVIAERADAIWDSGWRPRHLHFMMTTYYEHEEVTIKVMQGVITQIRELGVPATIWLGSGARYDEILIERYLRQNTEGLDVRFVMVRQNVSGKRMAIGLVLRAMNRANIDKDDIIAFMDGDSILASGCLRRCAPLFKLDPELQAVTTDEEVLCKGPAWIRYWLTMRFAQRRIAMQSHALSNKVLTLTGRLSIFRANHLANMELIQLLENDYLEHWLWGRFRFLSGDDKSTWFYMLTQNAKLLYVPDAMAYTVEYIEGSGLTRMVENFRRWSGNMLRNGARALALGPQKVGLFIWWCVLDQRISMWTMLFSPVMAVLATIIEPSFIIGYILWVSFSRLMLSLVLYCYAREVNLYFPFILYFNQLINSMVKVYCLFRLSKQKWANRNNQAAGFENTLLNRVRNATAFVLTLIYSVGLVLFVASYSGIWEVPGIGALANARLHF